MSSRNFRVGIAGAGLRSAALAKALQGEPRTTLVAVHDPLSEAREQFARAHDVETTCETFDELLDCVDIVLLVSPQHHHAPQAIAALERGIHVLSEVPAAVSLEQSQALVAAARSSSALYGMAENERWFAPHLVARGLARNGSFGELYYGESDYVQNARAQLHTDDGTPTWKALWWTGRDGNTYPTHSLGPILACFEDRIVAVCCSGAGRHSGYELQSTTVLLARTVKGGLIRVRFEWLSNTPPHYKWAMQGTQGGYFLEIAPRSKATSGVHLQGRSEARVWDPVEGFTADHLPARYRRPPADADPFGLGYADAWMLQDFVDSIEAHEAFDVDVYTALDLTLPGLAAETSIAQDGSWVHVPNPRAFTAGIGS